MPSQSPWLVHWQKMELLGLDLGKRESEELEEEREELSGKGRNH